MGCATSTPDKPSDGVVHAVDPLTGMHMPAILALPGAQKRQGDRRWVGVLQADNTYVLGDIRIVAIEPDAMFLWKRQDPDIEWILKKTNLPNQYEILAVYHNWFEPTEDARHLLGFHDVIVYIMQQRLFPHTWFPHICDAFSMICLAILQHNARTTVNPPQVDLSYLCEHTLDFYREKIQQAQHVCCLSPLARYEELKKKEDLNVATTFACYAIETMPPDEEKLILLNMTQPERSMDASMLQCYCATPMERRTPNMTRLLVQRYLALGNDYQLSRPFSENEVATMLNCLDHEQVCKQNHIRWIMQNISGLVRSPLLVQLGQLYNDMHQHSNAIAHLTKIIEAGHEWKTSEQMQAHSLRAVGYAATGEKEKAEADQRAAQRLAPSGSIISMVPIGPLPPEPSAPCN